MADRPIQITVGSREFSLTHPNKVLFPDIEATKSDLVDYYRHVAPVMVPHLQGRPLMLERHPDGIGGQKFFQKEASDYFPDWIPTARMAKQGGSVRHVVCDDEATLAYLAGQACTTLHSWLSRADRPDHPDRLIFDLDPSGGDFEPVRDAARDLRRLLEQVGLVPFVQTTGSRGLHVTVPLESGADFDQVRSFARHAAEALVTAKPDERTLQASKAKRGGRVYIDVMRNAYAQTAVTPYAVRALPAAPVATPLEWNELSDRRTHARRYTLANLRRRLARRDDPWRDIQAQARPLEGARGALEEAVGSRRVRRAG